MPKELTSYFTDHTKPRVLLGWEEDHIGGGIGLYLPSRGDIAVHAPGYTQHTLATHPFFQYNELAFGRGNVNFVEREELDSYNGAPVMTHRFTAENVDLANERLGYEVSYMLGILDNKYHFQQMVQNVLGTDYSTTPHLLEEGASLAQVFETAQSVHDLGGTTVVLKIPEGTGGGAGIGFVKNSSDIMTFLEQQEVAFDKSGGITKPVIVERFVKHTLSPSVTFYAGSDGATPLSVNNQLIQEGRFIGSTNILPNEIPRDQIIHTGQKLADFAHSLGKRGLFGFDAMLSTSDLVFVECNDRGTGSTNPEITARKVVQFSEKPGWAHWVGLIGSYQQSTSPDLSHVLDILDSSKALYTGIHTDLDTPKAVIDYGMFPNIYFLSWVWEKGTTPPAEGFAIINDTMKRLGTDIQISLPQGTYE